MAHHDGREPVTRGRLRARARRLDATPGAALGALGAPRVAWSAPDGPTVVGCESAAVVTASGADRFASVRDDAAGLFDGLDYEGPRVARPRLLGGFAFGDATPGAPWRGFPGAYFLLPRVQVTRTGSETWLTVIDTGADAPPDVAFDEAATALAAGGATDDADGDNSSDESEDTRGGTPPGVDTTERVPSREVWEADVHAALDRIAAGDLRKVVLAGALEADLGGEFDLPATLARLGAAYGGCYRFAVDPGEGGVFFGATPELLAERAGEQFRTAALAGSAERGDTPVADERRARELAASEKGRREHELVVEAVRDRLAPFASRVSVGERRVRALENVQHLETPVTGTVATSPHVLDLAAALHPTPAVGGLPPEVARTVIRETESFDRGWYAAPVGWFDADGDGTFAVGIRSAVVSGGRATLYAGNGIVADSDPAAEWAELQLKYRPVLDHLR